MATGGTPKVNIGGIGGAGGSWKPITGIYVKVSGTWKCILSAWRCVVDVWKECGIADRTYTWTGAVDGNWSTDGNWDIDGYPQGFGDIAIIDIADTVTLDVALPNPIKSLTIDNAGASLQLDEDLVVLTSVDVTLGTLDMNGQVLSVEGDVTVAGTLQTGGGTISCGGDWTVTGTWTHEDGKVLMNGAGAQAFDCAAADAFYDLEFNSGGDLTFGNNFTVARHLIGTATTVPGATSVTLNGAGTPANLAGLTFYDLVINKTNAADIVQATGGLTITNTFTGTKGEFKMGSYTHVMSHATTETWGATSADFTQTPETSTLHGIGVAAELGLATSAANKFYNVTADNDALLGGGGVAIDNVLSVAGNLNMNNRNLTVKHLTGTGSVVCAGAEIITLKGDMDIAGITAAPSTLNIQDTGQESNIGAYTLNNLTCNVPNKVIRFKESATITIGAALTINGTSGNEVQLRSQVEGTQWGIDNAGNSESVDYAYIKDSSPVLSNDITATNSIDGGNNDVVSPGWVIT